MAAAMRNWTIRGGELTSPPLPSADGGRTQDNAKSPVQGASAALRCASFTHRLADWVPLMALKRAKTGRRVALVPGDTVHLHGLRRSQQAL